MALVELLHAFVSDRFACSLVGKAQCETEQKQEEPVREGIGNDRRNVVQCFLKPARVLVCWLRAGTAATLATAGRLTVVGALLLLRRITGGGCMGGACC